MKSLTPLQLALRAHAAGDIANAERLYLLVLNQDPLCVPALGWLGTIKAQNQQFEVAISLLGRALELEGSNQEFVLSYANVLQETGRYEEAITYYRKSIQTQRSALSFSNLAACYNEKGMPDQALLCTKEALVTDPGFPDAWCNQGVALNDLRRHEEALTSYDRAIALRANYTQAWSNRGVVLNDLGRHKEALESYDRAIELNPKYAQAWSNRGVSLNDLMRHEEALVSCDRAIELKPDYPQAWSNRGVALNDLGHHEEALVSYNRALELEPKYAQAWSNRGAALNDLRRYEEAIGSYERAIAIKSDYFQAWSNRGIALNHLKRHEKALLSFDQAIAIKADYADAWFNRSVALSELKRYDEALPCLTKVIHLDPEIRFALGDLIHIQMRLCAWVDLKSRIESCGQRALEGESVATPFPVLSFSDSPEFQLRVASIYDREYVVSRKTERIGRHLKRNSIRIAYFSADFHDHATMHLMIELFERHDKSRFEVYGFSFGPDIDDEMRQRVKSSMREFVDISRISDGEAAALARDYEIDIAVDLKGYTQDSRPQIFAERVAPIQISYLGYPGTMGTTNIDYLIADKILIPEHSRSAYSEKIIYMPNCYQANSRRRVTKKVPTREEAGLPANGFVFCCFNNNWKILPEMFDCWMRILKRVDGSVMWLFGDNEMAASNLRKEAESRDIAPSRIVFAKRIPNEEHLARYRLADLFLDTFPYNAHTTASDALWVGTPILTLEGATFASRVAASILHSIQLPELITRSIEDYESLAIQLALDPARLAAIKANLERNKSTAPLFDTQLFTEQIESAYQTVYDQYYAGLIS